MPNLSLKLYIAFIINVSESKDVKTLVREQYLQIFIIILTATILSTLANLEGEETFEASMLGQAEEVVQERICDDELILIKK